MSTQRKDGPSLCAKKDSFQLSIYACLGSIISQETNLSHFKTKFRKHGRFPAPIKGGDGVVGLLSAIARPIAAKHRGKG
jgi:hypothetical protein